MNSSHLFSATVSSEFFTNVDYSIFGALLVCSVAIGLYYGIFSKTEQTAEEYLHGGHKMQPLPIAISLVVSQLSSLSIITLPAEIYWFGWQFALLLPGITFITIAAYYLFVPVFYNNSIDNCYAYLEMRFCKPIRDIVTLVFLISGTIEMPIFLFISSLAYSEVTGQNVYIVNAIVCFCCVTYTMLGGIKAVVWTDVVQAFVMLVPIVIVAFFGVQKVGGLTEVMDRAVAGGRIFPPIMTMDLTTRHTFWNVMLGTFLVWSCHITLHQSCVQRIVSLPTLTDSRRSLVLFCIGWTVLMFFIFFIGITMYAFYYDCDPLRSKIVNKADRLVPRFVQDVAGHLNGMPGMFISCIFSASMSTVSAMMNSLAGVLYLNYIKPLKCYRHTERRANHIMKAIIILFGIECVFGAYFVAKFSSLLQLVLSVGGVKAGAMFGVFSLGMLYPWANRHGGLYGLLAGISVVFILVVNTQIATGRGALHYEPLPTSIDGCSNGTIVDGSTQNITSNGIAVDDSFAFYKISYMWYSPLGATSTWIIGIIVSYFTGGQDINESNLSLLAPFIQNILPQKYRHTEMRMVTQPESKSGEIIPLSADRKVYMSVM